MAKDKKLDETSKEEKEKKRVWKEYYRKIKKISRGF